MHFVFLLKVLKETNEDDGNGLQRASTKELAEESWQRLHLHRKVTHTAYLSRNREDGTQQTVGNRQCIPFVRDQKSD